MSAIRNRRRSRGWRRSVKPTKPTIPSERVPDFNALKEAFRAQPDVALWLELSHDFTLRGDESLRRSLFMAARQFLPLAYQFRGAFTQACKKLAIKGHDIESMLVRFLFGTNLDKHAVHLWSYVIKYWRECEPGQRDVVVAIKRSLTALKLDYRAFKKLQQQAATEADLKPELIWEFVSESLSDFEPNIIITKQIVRGAAPVNVFVYLSLQFSGGAEHLYAVPLTDKRIRELVRLIHTAKVNTTTRGATWVDELWRVAEAAE